jgi:hypothetical protein
VVSSDVPQTSSVFEAYDSWNEAVEEEFFPDTAHGGRPTSIHAFGGGFLIRGPRGRFIKGTTSLSLETRRPVYLDMEDDVVARLADRAGAQGDPKEAFTEAVRPTLYLWPERDGCLLDLHIRRLRRWQDSGRAGPPPCLALLAFFSLAAEGMRTDENLRSNNYYSRLAELLGSDLPGQRPAVEKLGRDFRKDSLTLWNALNAWLLEADGARGLPTAYSFDWRSYVGVPISQALLREEERLALRDMFVRYRLRPGQQIAASDMMRLLEDWLPGSDLNEGIKRLFRQSDAKARFADIAAIELEHWDGTVPASVEGVSTPADGLLLAAGIRKLPRPQVQFSLVLPGITRAPVGRYVLVDDASPTAKAALAGCSGSLALVDPPGSGWRRFAAEGSVDFPDLLLSSMQLRADGTERLLTRKPRRLVILERDDEFRIAVEVDRIQLARENVLLAHDSLASAVEELLQTCARDGFRRWRPDQLRGLPLDWQAWTGVELMDVPHVPDTPETQDLARLIPIEWTKIAIGGGLALPGTATWLRGVPPEIRMAAFVDREVVASLVQTDDLEGDRQAEEELLTFDGAAAVGLAEESLTDGDYRVSLRESGVRGKPLASSSFRLRSGDSPRLLTEIEGSIAHRLLRDAPDAALTASISDVYAGASSSNGHPPSTSMESSVDLGALPAALPPLAPLDPESEADADDPVVEAVGTLTGCLLGRGHRYRLDDAGRDVMLRRRRAARRMIPAECMDCGHQKLFPPHLRRASAPARRRDAQPAVAAARSPEPISPARAIPEPPPAAASFNQLLDALTYARAGHWPLFERLAQQVSDEPWFPLEAARLLSALGHIDLVLDLARGRPSAWAARPACLVMAANGAFLAGGRPQALLEAVHRRVDAAGGRLVVEPAASAPDAVLVYGLSGGCLDELAKTVSAEGPAPLVVDHGGAERLARALPALGDVCRALPTFAWPRVASERFDFASNKWTEGSVQGPGAYKFLIQPLRFGAVVDRGSSPLIAADSRLVKWLGAAATNATLLAYEPHSQELLCRLGAQLPGLYERAAVLASGRAPEKRVDGTVAYAAVPAPIAAALHGALTHPLGAVVAA